MSTWTCAKYAVFTARCTIVQSAVLRSHVVCLSVCLSVTLVDQEHIGWKSWKLIARTISLTPSLFVGQRRSTYSQGNMGKFGGDWRLVGFVGKSGVLEHKSINISEMRSCVLLEEKLLWRAYRNSPSLSRMVPSPTPYGLLFPKIGGLQPPPKTSIAIISGTDEATDFKFSRYIRRVQPNKSPLKI